MGNTSSENNRWQELRQKVQPALDKTGQVLNAIGHVVQIVCGYIMRFRKIILAIPVVFGALYMAKFSSDRLPQMVGINLQESGEYAQMVSRDVAVLGPLAVTGVCLLLMFCSRRTLYPWLISLFTLLLPLLIVLTNMLPA